MRREHYSNPFINVELKSIPKRLYVSRFLKTV